MGKFLLIFNIIFLSFFLGSKASEDTLVNQISEIQGKIDIVTYLKNMHDSAIQKIGQVAPNWKVLKGNFPSILDLKGNLVLIEFTSTNCSACIQAEKDIIRIDSIFKNDKFKLVIIDYRIKLKDGIIFFHSSPPVDSYNIIDMNIRFKYYVAGFPTFFLLDKEGKIIFNTIDYKLGNRFDELIELIKQKK
jgi:thioredoxin-related protein